MQTLQTGEYLGVIHFKCSYSINILSKYSSLIVHIDVDVRRSTIHVRRSTHRLSIFEGRHINHWSSKVDTSIIGLRTSTHPSPTHRSSTHIVTSIFEGRHIDLRRATHRSSKVDASIFEDRRRKHHTYSYNSSSNIVHNCAPKSLE